MNDQLSQLRIMATVMRASSHRFVGRLGREPEIRYLESGKCVANGRIAINRPDSSRSNNSEPDWFKVEMWGELAQAFADQCHKGDLIEVFGRVKTDRWTDQSTGEVKLDLVITADLWSLVKSANAPAAAVAAAPAAAQPAAAWRPNPSSNEDIPF